MPKNIVICSDGTGNSALKGRGTNVFKLYEAVDLSEPKENPSRPQQVAFYDDGVGTDNLKLLRLAGGAFGFGLSRNVKQLYTELARVHEHGDNIFLFGFSRGAYTVRTLAGLIVDCGIPKYSSDGELRKAVKDAFKKHRRRYKRFMRMRNLLQKEKKPDGSVSQDNDDRKVKFIGVWDTVDAVGFPIDEIADGWNQVIYPFKFPDFTLSPLVEKACHAICIDDERHTFHPVMWNEHGEKGNRIEQVWFSGVHSNVGGGYEKQGMSLVALYWMMTKAEEKGLRFVQTDRDCYREHENVHDKLYDSRSGLKVYYRYKPRNIGETCKQAHVRPKIHLSVLKRIAQRTDGYAPGNLPQDFDVVATGGHLPGNPAPVVTAVNARGSLLQSVGGLVRVRRFAYHVLVAYSVLLAATHWMTLGRPALDGEWTHVFRGLLSSPLALGILVVIIAALVGGYWAGSEMKKHFSEFWSMHIREFRKVLADLQAPRP